MIFSFRMERILIVLFVFCQCPVYSQQFGAFPPKTRWEQINTDTARIIFQRGATLQAQRIATLVHKAAMENEYYLGPGLHKINIVLHNQTTLANGYVGLAPFRSEYYLVPPSDVFEFGNLPWYENLAVHEYRHVQQYNNFRNGISNGVYHIFGEEGLALANALAIPDWFYEGDAVHSETALTTQGRGRLSSFLSGYNSLWLAGKNYSWMKLRNGSYKDYVPDHYHLGYLLVNYGYLKYGDGFWKNVTRDATAFKGIFYPFQKAIYKYSGTPYRQFREEAFTFYKTRLHGREVPAKSKTVSNVYCAQFISADSLIYLKTAFNKKPAFYIQHNGVEHRLAVQNIGSELWFAYRQRKIVYTGYSVNPRWGLIDFNDIVITDIDSRKTRRLTSKEKYFTPDLSPDGTEVVAVHINDSLETELRILGVKDGKLLRVIKAPADLYFTNPRFVDQNRVVVGTRNIQAMMTLQVINLSNGEWEQLLPWSQHTIGDIFIDKDRIYFTGNFAGNDDIFRMEGKGGSLIQLTMDVTGNYYASAVGDTVLWSHFTSQGLALTKAAFHEIPTAAVNRLTINETVKLYPVASEHDISSVPDRLFAITPYKKTTGLIHFHSLTPYYSDPEITLSLYSENILNSFTNEVYYQYNQNETSHGFGFNSSYGGFFPVLNAGAEYVFNRTLNTSSQTITLNQYELKAGYEIPLNFTRGTSYKSLSFGTNFVFNRLIPTGSFKDSASPRNISYLDNFVNWAHYGQSAVQHIFPKLGYVISVDHRVQVRNNGYQVLGSAQLFLPSIANHSIVLSGEFQETDTNNIVFANRFALSRGYPGYYFSRMWRLSANYHFPIAYPDFGIAQLVYFKRLRGNLFYDFTRVYSKNKQRFLDLRSSGAELYFDTRWWNELPVTFGIRYSYLADYLAAKTNRAYFEVILPVNLIPNR